MKITEFESQNAKGVTTNAELRIRMFLRGVVSTLDSVSEMLYALGAKRIDFHPGLAVIAMRFLPINSTSKLFSRDLKNLLSC